MIRAFPTLILRGVLASGRVSILILVKPKGLEWHLTIKSGKVQNIDGCAACNISEIFQTHLNLCDPHHLAEWLIRY